MTSVITSNNLNKYYRKFHALKDIHLNIPQGAILGLMGPNGAGKTTLLKVLLGLCSYQGNLEILGTHPPHKHQQLMKKMCFIADVGILPRWLKVNQAIEFVAGVHPHFHREKAQQLLTKTNIRPHQQIKTLSKGMIVQLHLALIMAIDADILILDEPTLGLDIIHRKQFYQHLLNDYYSENRTIIITTHQVEEVEDILTHLIMIDQGKQVLDLSMDEYNQTFMGVKVLPDKIQQLASLQPFHQYQQLGHTIALFENVEKETLTSLGDVFTPSISDIFIAKLSGETL